MMSPSADPEAEPSDADLVAAVRAGDTGAYGTLYTRHAGGARRLAYTLVNDSADADDLVAETFAKVLATLRSGRGPERAFRPYLYTTLKHVRYDRLRLDRRVELTDDLSRYEAGVPFADPTVDRLERAYAARAFASSPNAGRPSCGTPPSRARRRPSWRPGWVSRPAGSRRSRSGPGSGSGRSTCRNTCSRGLRRPAGGPPICCPGMSAGGSAGGPVPRWTITWPAASRAGRRPRRSPRCRRRRSRGGIVVGPGGAGTEPVTSEACQPPRPATNTRPRHQRRG